MEDQLDDININEIEILSVNETSQTFDFEFFFCKYLSPSDTSEQDYEVLVDAFNPYVYAFGDYIEGQFLDANSSGSGSLFV